MSPLLLPWEVNAVCLLAMEVASTFKNSGCYRVKLGLLMANFKEALDPNFLRSLHLSSSIPTGVISLSPGERLAVQGLSPLLQFGPLPVGPEVGLFFP